MAIRELTTDLNIVAALDTEPNDVGGLTDAQLKAKFDEGGNAIKTYINDTLIPDIGTETDAKIMAAELASGNVPLGGATGQALMKNSGTDFDAGWQTVSGASAATPSTLMQRDANGRAKVADPVEAGDIANKQYVDSMEPIGIVKLTVRDDLDSSWVLCNGAKVNQANYPELYAYLTSDVNDPWLHTSLSGFTNNNPTYYVYSRKFVNGYDLICGHVNGNSYNTPVIFYKQAGDTSWAMAVPYAAATSSQTIMDITWDGTRWIAFYVTQTSCALMHATSLSTPTGSWITINLDTISIGTQAAVGCIEYNGTHYVIPYYNSTNGFMFAYSTNLTAWTSVSLAVNGEYPIYVRWSGTEWQVVSYATATNMLVTYHSANVASGWARTVTSIFCAPGGMGGNSAGGYANGYFVMSGRDATNKPIIVYSSDFVTWTTKVINAAISVGAAMFPSYDGNYWYVILSAQTPSDSSIYYCSTLGGTWLLKIISTLSGDALASYTWQSMGFVYGDDEIVFFIAQNLSANGYAHCFSLCKRVPVESNYNVFGYMKAATT